MASGVTREAYFETGLAVLADLGYGGLKLAEVCNRLGVTTGSFYHYFSGWPTYTRELIEFWRRERTTAIIESVRDTPDPRRRIGTLVQESLQLPHGAEAAIRVWSSFDPDVYEVQVAVDRQRFDIMYESALEVLGNERQAHVFASLTMYILVGYEQATLPRDPGVLAWIAEQVLRTLDSGGFATIPGGE
ncbi:TetR/AcrR family transcriptional regulator [Mycolicibacterium thermoresistibile]|jgi:AcrR family transcriptional regulator|uniref:TetR/AcrR family transcriptional regulator n=1 Tax=Mycolicibacterium thermoresistibile TaxID=1797 RepID=UPI00059053B7|nr:TetR/AcrR family transcriptional regulator [Mycolicibacterium thermoresistibile]MCV7189455.1 TetR/AcrR family transcriptional regulator [Mycolicibacterium thermoresistibile]SNW16328.1 transcriptional regulator [Mycolicibacterium thermoresistibile]